MKSKGIKHRKLKSEGCEKKIRCLKPTLQLAIASTGKHFVNLLSKDPSMYV